MQFVGLNDEKISVEDAQRSLTKPDLLKAKMKLYLIQEMEGGTYYQAAGCTFMGCKK
jgi:hypothetical protein